MAVSSAMTSTLDKVPHYKEGTNWESIVDRWNGCTCYHYSGKNKHHYVVITIEDLFHSHNFKGWQTRVRYFYVQNVSPEFRDDSNWKRLLAFLLVDLRPSEGGTLESDPMTKVASPSSDTEPLGVPEGGILRATASGRGELSTSGAGYLTGDLSEVQRWIFFHAIVNLCRTMFSQAK